ncbi:glycerophosphoryl diester phosphodiesterase [Loigolactobacillus coryniformis]|uniref:glycerophosphodiester phosphodiesterase family protein n=1 Tax=Loigolactobacillus coryniformis TaxID=1610 RepID=UPI00233FE1B7|nr:glycerophosphodiester phosphodiesterase family protein [Loigolactobacillus coryniformis]MDC4186473.1 glycerophosphoryl diester phosphodiesterase [Loigolactobacillus coryniformis]
MDSKIILAHRGISSLAPENTLAAFNLLPKYNIKWLETDLGITSDKHVIIMHDDYLDRTTNGHGLLASTSYRNLHKLSAGAWFSSKYADERVPTLEELVSFVNRTKINVNIELKAVVSNNANEMADSLVHQFAQALDMIDPAIDIIVSSANPIMLLKLQQLRPHTEFAVLFDKTNLKDDWQLIMQSCHAQFIHPESEGLTREKIEQFKSSHYRVNVWTVNTLCRCNQLFNWGVDGVFTDFAQRLSYTDDY